MTIPTDRHQRHDAAPSTNGWDDGPPLDESEAYFADDADIGLYEPALPPAKKRKANANADKTASDIPVRTPVLISLADVEPTEVQWLWKNRIALGKLTLLVGDPGEGKSFLSLDITSRVTTGAKWPDGSGHAPLGGVVLLGAEDDLADTVRPRLDAACADVSRVVALQAVKSRDEQGDYARGLSLDRDLDVVEQAIVATPDCKLLIVDPISAYMGDADSHKNADVRSVLAPLAELRACSRSRSEIKHDAVESNSKQRNRQ